VSAKDKFKQALEKSPNDVDTLRKYAQSLVDSYDWENAASVLTRLRQNPSGRFAADFIEASLFSKRQKYEQAHPLFLKALSSKRVDVSVYLATARNLIGAKQYKLAQLYLATAKKYAPLSAEVSVAISKCLAADDSVDRSIVFLQDEIQRKGAHTPVLFGGLAELYIQKGSWDLAQSMIDQAMTADPSYGFPWFLQAQVIKARGGDEKRVTPKVLDAYRSLIERNPYDPTGYLERFKIFMGKGDFQAADSELANIDRISPQFPGLYFLRGSVLSALGNSKAAIGMYQRELKNNPGDIKALMQIGKEHLKLREAEAARKVFVQLMQANPKYAEAKAHAAYANQMLGNFPVAISLLEGAIQLDPANPTFWKRKGLLHQEVGDVGNAIAAFRKYLEMEPDAPDRAEIQRFL
jgi:tetratricopeptide (TPR) repeat protein